MEAVGKAMNDVITKANVVINLPTPRGLEQAEPDGEADENAKGDDEIAE